MRYLLAILLGTLLACSSSAPEPAEDAPTTLQVYVVNYPLQYFAERIGGDSVEVSLPAPADEDPAYWEPSPEVIQQYQQADLILLNGADYAKWVTKATLPMSAMVNTTAAASDRYIEIEALSTHTHGPEGEHAHGGTAFTTWLDPAMAVIQAEAVAAALEKLSPPDAAAFQQNLAALKSGLAGLDTALNSAATEAPLLGSHPVYQYLARAGGLNLKSVHWEPNEMPPAAEWRKLDTLLQTHPARLMFWEAPPLPEVAAELKKRGVSTTVFSTCNNVPESGDFLSVFRQSIADLSASAK
jgi:zinc transport system substrate-binding protein